MLRKKNMYPMYNINKIYFLYHDTAKHLILHIQQ